MAENGLALSKWFLYVDKNHYMERKKVGQDSVRKFLETTNPY